MNYPSKRVQKSDRIKTLKPSPFLLRFLAALSIGGGGAWQLFPLIASAQTVPLTPAGTAINNTATGTYVDPNTGETFNTTSNTVTATVAEVAGVAAVPSGIIDVNGGSVTTNDQLLFTFLVTNVGNEVSALHIPSTVTPVGANLGSAQVLNGVTLTAGVYVTEINGVILARPVILPANGNTNDATFINAINNAAGGNYTALNGGTPFNGSINANSGIKVIVPATVTATVAGNPVSVTLGDTGANNNNAGTQNQPDSGLEPPTLGGTDPISAASEIYTINFAGAPPANGVRESSAFQTVPLATQINSLALATILKTRIAYNANSAATFTDDTLTYRLDLRVESAAPTGSTGIVPAPLLGTSIRVDGASPVTKVLISDAIPTNTTIDLTALPPATVTINGVVWTRVYTAQPVATGPLAATQDWLTTAPTAGTTRIGYIADGPLAPGYTTALDPNGFRIQVVTTGLTAVSSAVTIANVAQVFGQSTAGSISPTNPLVYDESGDQNPNNFENGSPSIPPITTTNTSPSGVADPNTDGTDSNNGGNNNQGTGPGGEDNVFTINPPGSILNGPQGQAGAIGPNGTNQTDFANKSAPIAAGLKTGDPVNPAAVTFTNTVQNPSSNTSQLDNVTLEPISATLAAAATGTAIANYDLSNLPLTNAPLPEGTTVLIAYGNRAALYTLTSGEFVLTSSSPATVSVSGTTVTITPGANETTPAPIIIPTVAIGQSLDYYVQVDLPGGAAGAVVTKGYSVPIVAYVNSNTTDGSTFKTTGTQLGQDNPFNIEINRVYTGYLDLVKLSRVLQGTGPALSVPADGTFSNTSKTPAPGNIIEYLLSYTNISTPASGSGNVVLNANNIVITEDGAVAPNNWATTTLNVPSTARVDQDGTQPTPNTVPTYNAVITFFTGATATTTTDPTVTRYLDSIPTLTPGQTGYFKFQRQVK
ncbi:beta strand repeat-containing protein [Pseudanabaena sp. ABRG5-3]|uniref:beta strand repeat-containing protein n=1 Tax=Pseudanabaena sp. ABRG5-3 TaxID=685565 RepID=UPI000F839EB6|nr:hypothetical protein [Pseudanabaena sp. ABRG5-3]